MTTADRAPEANAAKSLGAARALIAREILDTREGSMILGDVTLQPHQQRAVSRLARLLRTHGGALLADPTGLGKTFIALGVARDVERVLIICPAGLRDAWRAALARTARSAKIISFERLSRGVPDLADVPELVIIDESHHLRNSRTRRYDAVARVCDRARVLLLSATPVQNRRDDLTAQLAVFLGAAADGMSSADVARFVVRRDVDDARVRLPRVVGPHWLPLPVEDDVLEDIVALPPAVPLADEGDAHVLLRYTLLRQWSSSRAALVAGLRGRLARGVALLAALDAGRRPARRELTAWAHAEDAVQLALPELLVFSSSGGDDRALRVTVEQHVAALRALLHRLRHMADPDSHRAELLRELRRRHPDARIIAFSQYAETVRAISRFLISRDIGVAELTARGGRVAGGRIHRREVLAQFAPGAPAASRAGRIDLLVTTDVSSEGLDLQMASVVVHLDLPWNPARLEQRVGRACRLGAPHDRVFVYALAPPATAERVLTVEARLRAKLRIAATLVGIGPATMPNASLPGRASAPETMSAICARLERWREGFTPGASPTVEAPAVAAVHAPVDGWLALLAAGPDRILVGDDGSGATTDSLVVERLVSLAEGPPADYGAYVVARATDAVTRWWQRRLAREQLARLGPDGILIRKKLALRIASLLATAPRHARAALARRASAARQTLRSPLGVAAERRLAELADRPIFEESCLTELSQLGAGRQATPANPPRILAIVAMRAVGISGGESP